MSFILDALKKSESERRNQQDAGFSNVPIAADRSRGPVWLWIVAALLLVNVFVLTGLLLHSGSDDTAAAVPGLEPPAAVGGAGDVAAVSTPVADRADSFERRVQQAASERQASPAPSSEALTTTTEIAPPPAAEPRAAVTMPGRVTDELPQLDELRASGEIDLDNLRLDIHVYSDRPADRFVFINMVKHREGSTTSDGLTVREILPDGVVLDWRGREFILPRQ
jgi:general secretion pathway protein B